MNNVSVVALLVLSLISISYQDGFNFYKALNRTPISRVERFYREGDGSNRPFKVPVPMSKRLFFEGSIDDDIDLINQDRNEEFLSLLLNRIPSKIKLRNLIDINEADLKKCMDIRNLLLDSRQ